MNKHSVWKYELRIDDEQVVDMPRGARILSAQSQYEIVAVWALVDPEAPREKRRFRIVGTGHAITDDVGDFVGTVQQAGGQLVWHIFVQRESAGDAR